MIRLKQIHIAKGLSVPALSRLTNVAVRTIENIERRNDCRVSAVIKLSEALGVTLD